METPRNLSVGQEGQTPSHEPPPDATAKKGYVLTLTFIAALGGLLFGYDTAVISGAIGFLRTHFGLSAAETGWAASSALVGCIIGAGAAGHLSDSFGRKKAQMLAAVLFTVSAVWSAIPTTVTEFNIARIIGGVGVGMASLLSPLYIAEISPAAIRGRLVSFNQLAIVSGILIVYFANYFIAGIGDEAWNVDLGWRWMFASEALPAALFFFALMAIPESPRWLVKQNRAGAAEAVLTRIGGAAQAARELQAIRQTIDEEAGRVGDLFRPPLRRAMIIGIILAILQQITGINVFMYYAPEIFKGLGAGTDVALLQTVIIGIFNVTFTLLAIRTVDRLGRKPLLMIGSAGMGISLVGLGIAAAIGSTAAWVLVFVLGYIACFAMSLGPVVWVVIAEIFPTKIRGRAMALATLLLWAANYVVSQTFPILNEDPFLVATFNHAFPFWLYALFCLVMLIFVHRVVPETRGKTLEEIEHVWHRGRHEQR
jgi:sugar porter (SP) family MFS transporter